MPPTARGRERSTNGPVDLCSEQAEAGGGHRNPLGTISIFMNSELLTTRNQSC